VWCWRRIEKTIWSNCVRNEEVLQRVKQESNSVQTIKWRKGNLIGHILCRNCLVKHIIEGKIQGRIDVAGRRCKQLLDDLKEKKRYWKMKDNALWRSWFGRGYGSVVRQTTE